MFVFFGSSEDALVRRLLSMKATRKKYDTANVHAKVFELIFRKSTKISKGGYAQHLVCSYARAWKRRPFI